jgi:nitrite reductase/ring-hydroxylating ferredoxin subunit
MKEFIVENRSIIVVNNDGKYHILGGKCPHYGASLINGLI